jgi:PIN domain nuclease of toxin-antitoxin system
VSRVLLDTHVFVWWTQGGSTIRAEWEEAINNRENLVFVSASSAWEIETKKRRGKLEFVGDVTTLAIKFDFELLSVDMAHAALAGSLDWSHRDPFDRMLAAQAIADDMLLLTADEAFKSAPGVRVL